MKFLIKDPDEGISFLHGLWIFVFYVLVTSIVVSIPVNIITSFPAVKAHTELTPYFDELSSILGYLTAIKLLFMRLEKTKPNNLRFRGKININLFVFSILFCIGYYLFSGTTIHLALRNIPLPRFIEKAFEDMVVNKYVMFFSFVISGPIFEEILCRGILLEVFLKRYKPPAAIFFSSFVFAFIHMNIPQGVNALFLGLIFGFIYYKSNSLTLCIITHSFNNLLVMVLSYIKIDLGNKFNPIQLAMGLIIMTLACVVLKLFNKKTSSSFSDNHLCN